MDNDHIIPPASRVEAVCLEWQRIFQEKLERVERGQQRSAEADRTELKEWIDRLGQTIERERTADA